MSELDSVLTLSQRMLGVMKPRPAATLHVGGKIIADSGLTVTGPVVLPVGSAQLVIGAWNAGSSFSTAAGPWVESTIQVTVTSTGAQARIEWSVTLANSLAGTLNYIGIGWDGAAQWNVGQVHAPGANYHFVVSGAAYANLTAGPHRVAIFAGVSSGTMQFQGTNNMLTVTEQRS